MTSKQVLKLLEARHRKDLFVSECKNGPTLTAASSHLRLDAWAMRRSWTNPCVWGYEIKVSRSDFLQDEKWRRALDYCNQFYFVCPYGLIQLEELPAEVGLLWVAKTGTRLYIKRKAVYRKQEIPESLWKYILFFRAKIVPRTEETETDKRVYWKEWLTQKEEDKQLGRHVSKSLAQKYERDVRVVMQKQKEIERDHEKYRWVEIACKEIGLSRRDLWSQESVRLKLTELGRHPDIKKVLQLLYEATKHLKSFDNGTKNLNSQDVV